MKHFLKETDLTALGAWPRFSLARGFKRGRGKAARRGPGRPDLGPDVRQVEHAHPGVLRGRDPRVGGPPALPQPQRPPARAGARSIEDTARVLSRFVHGIVIRTYRPCRRRAPAAAASVPVVNGLTDFLHPCQIYADAFTAAERWAGPERRPRGRPRGAARSPSSATRASTWPIPGSSAPASSG